jgi:hypothetical protein
LRQLRGNDVLDKKSGLIHTLYGTLASQHQCACVPLAASLRKFIHDTRTRQRRALATSPRQRSTSPSDPRPKMFYYI